MYSGRFILTTTKIACFSGKSKPKTRLNYGKSKPKIRPNYGKSKANCKFLFLFPNPQYVKDRYLLCLHRCREVQAKHILLIKESNAGGNRRSAVANSPPFTHSWTQRTENP